MIKLAETNSQTAVKGLVEVENLSITFKRKGSRGVGS